eukprot:m.67173 g.67173  ORF g.67173 m.67173 type:complete len:77 (-) comp11867_c0_seq5:532-762(-)
MEIRNFYFAPKGVHKLIAGDSAVKYVAPNTFSKIEGTPNVYSYDSLRGYASIGFHFFNETLKRDEVVCKKKKLSFA